MIVVADTSPLNYLVWVDLDWILPELYSVVIVPSAVLEELLDAGAPLPVRQWARDLPPWVEVRSAAVELADYPQLQSLDKGERAAIALAATLQPSLILIDERAGASIAQGLGLSVTGTLGVIDEAARRKIVSLPDALDRLKRTSFRYPKALVSRLLSEDRSRK